ncbi:DUF4139 domain-containing protein, partial [Flavobacteriaceae bacterium]|nr:DUF4139 domain-containing protein [Flavobacteriaceae bacterium]
TLTIFKNGLVYLEKTTEIEVKSKEAILYPLPFSTNANLPIVMGSLQLRTDQNTINELNYTRRNLGNSKDQYYDNLPTLFKKNIGAKISVSTKEKTVDGVLKNIILGDLPNGKLVLVVGKEVHFIPINEVLSVNFIDVSKAIVDEDKDGDWVYALKFKENANKQPIAISYLQKGMSWLPNYYLDFENNNTANLKLEATLINDIEDFENTTVNLAVGFPTFNFSNVESPLTNQTDPSNNPSGYEDPYGQNSRQKNYNLGQNLSGNAMDFVGNYEPIALPENANQEDLYFFKKHSISAKKGSRIVVPIFETKIQYDDVYKVTLQPNLDDYGNFNKQNDQINYVSHHIEFKNDTGFPFTTGSIFFRKKQQNALKFLAQAELKYTAATAKADPKMTTSADVRVLEKEKEISRKELRDQHNSLYYQIKVESTIEVFNFKPESIAMKIDKLVGGTLDKSSKKWDFKSEITQDSNPQNKVTWKFDAPAGKRTMIVYSYQYLSN